MEQLEVKSVSQEETQQKERKMLSVIISFAIFFIVLGGILNHFTPLDAVSSVILSLFLFLITCSVYLKFRTLSVSLLRTKPFGENEGADAMLALSKLDMPALICRENGKILWCNEALQKASGNKYLFYGTSLDDLYTVDSYALEQAGSAQEPVLMCGRFYQPVAVSAGTDGEALWLITYTDITDLKDVRQRYLDEQVVVAYIVIDNIEELLEYIQEKFRSAVSEVEHILRDWALSMNAILRSYDNDKYILFFEADQMQKCLAERFSVLDDIRQVRVGDGMPVTVSMGICAMPGTLRSREEMAQAALDMALQRGGDQVVYRHAGGVEYYGGKTKAVHKRANVKARVMGNELAALLGKTENVLVMGHRFGDFDSFGASVGMARLAMNHGARVRIVVNRFDRNLLPCFEKISALPEYEGVFVSSEDATGLVKPDTLLILVDVNNFEHAECPLVMQEVKDIVIIDHHSQTSNFATEPRRVYIEPAASSASEMVSEILEQQMANCRLSKIEAEILMSGIMLDTKQFTKTMGTRTFAALAYLRGQGADPDEIADMFKADVEDMVKEAKFHAQIMMYKEKIAITVCDEHADASYRVIAAKAADKILSGRNVCASFALVRINNKVHISARSDGSVNVQLILEQLSGGGRFDNAGAQLEEESMKNAVLRLKEAIDKYI